MRAVIVNSIEGDSAVVVGERPVPEVGDHDVLVRVAAAAVNPADFFFWRSPGGGAVQPPFTPGMDVAGVVDSVGAEVSVVALGDRVMAVVNPRRAEGGGHAELVAVPDTWVVRIADSVPTSHAATIPMNGLTALAGLEALDLPVGATLGITGGAGHMSSLLVPLAKARGITVVADAAPADRAFVTALGADHVVPRGDFATAVRAVFPGGVDAVFDTAAITVAAIPAIKDNGAIAVVRGWDHADEPGRGITVHAVSVGNAIGNRQWLQQLADAAATGALPVRVAETVPPEDARSAYERVAAGGLRGRIVLSF